MNQYTAKPYKGTVDARDFRQDARGNHDRHGNQAADESCRCPQPKERKMCRPGPSILRLSGSEWMNKRTQILSMVAYATPRISPYKMCPTKEPKTALPCPADQSSGIQEASRKSVNGPKNHQKIPNPSPHPMQEP